MVINKLRKMIELITKASTIYNKPAPIKGLNFVRQKIKNSKDPAINEYLVHSLAIVVI